MKKAPGSARSAAPPRAASSARPSVILAPVPPSAARSVWVPGALVGDQLLGQENKQKEQQKAIDQQRAEIEKNRALIEELKKRNIEARETSRGVAVNLPSVNFQFDSADLTSDGRNKVNQIASIIKRDAPNRRVTVEGHASRESAAQEAYNQRLSERRANTVADELERNGVNGRNVSSQGLGTRAPIASQRYRKRPSAKPPRRSNHRKLVRAEAWLGAGKQASDIAAVPRDDQRGEDCAESDYDGRIRKQP